MNFYKRYMGDYMRDTSHLTLTDHGAYTVLLDHYYSTGRPLPGDAETLYRICRATTKPEQQSVKSVAETFFPLHDDGLRHNDRADKELAKWEAKSEANRLAGKLGGRPKSNPVVNPNGNPDAFRTVSAQEPRNNPLQKPEFGVKSKRLATGGGSEW